MQKQAKINGFTLVELLVSVGITAVLMLGIATFFSSTFRNMFMARDQVTNTQEEFVVNTIMGGKFVNVDHKQELNTSGGPLGSYAVLRNDMNTGDLPFTFIGTEDDHIVFKDFFVFNGRYANEESRLSAVVNPGGMSAIGAHYYVAAPLEDAIYDCDVVLNPCSALSLSGSGLPLNRPIDVASDGVDTLYVTDAGSNRILKVSNVATNPEVNELVTNTTFNHPTGIDFYTSPTGVNYLFVADTYNHVVKKINIVTGASEIVVGDGEDTVCDPSDGRDHTAKYCKLNFPTGVVAGHEASLNTDVMFIADTGNERILKVTDPLLDLSDLEVPFTLDSGTNQLSQIDFELSVDTNAVSEGASENTFRSGIRSKYSNSGKVASYLLNVDVSGVNEICSHPIIPPDPCTSYSFRSFDVASLDDNIFHEDDELTIDGFNYEVSTHDPNTTNILVTPIPPVPAVGNMRIRNNFPAGDYLFYIDFSNADIPSGFEAIKVTAIDDSGTPLATDAVDTVVYRVGDGEVGTEEDTIEVVYSSAAPEEFITGLSWVDELTLLKATMPDYNKNFTDYDYVSDFEVKDFVFTEPNTDKIIELEYEAKIGEHPTEIDPASGLPLPIWEENTLNANIKE